MWNVSPPRDGASTYLYGHLRSIPTHPPSLPESVSAVLLSVIDFFVQNILYSINSFSDGHCKFFITWQTKKLKFLLNNKVKNPTPLPSCVQRHVRLHLGMNGRNLPPALAAVDKTRLAMKLASLLVIYLCSLFVCLLAFTLHKTQEILKCNNLSPVYTAQTNPGRTRVRPRLKRTQVVFTRHFSKLTGGSNPG